MKEEFQNPEMTPAMNRLFSACPQLEYLHIREEFEEFIWLAAGLRLPPHLKYLSLYDGRYRFSQRLLSVENCMALAPNLRGLRLSQPLNSAPFPRLEEFVNLTYLGMEVTKYNGASLLAALPAMAGLKALELRRVKAGVVDDFPTHCPHLEHLSITDVSKEQKLEVLRQVGQRLENLRSLQVHEYRLKLSSVDCSWLRNVAMRGKLEYVQAFLGEDNTPGVTAEQPLPAEIVSNCKVG